MLKFIERIVPDTSVIVEGALSDEIKQGNLSVKEILIHEAVIAELEHQANSGQAIGFIGLDEIKELRELGQKHNFAVHFVGKRPSLQEIEYAKLGEIDAAIRHVAWESDATLITGDKIQCRVAEAKGIKVELVLKEKETVPFKLEHFFDENTMSVHLRENCSPMAKKGRPGNWVFTKLDDKPLKQGQLKDISRNALEEARMRADGFIEMQREGSTILQIGLYRIVITKPPFSDGWEITAVKPVRKLQLKDYNISEKLLKRISGQAEGILVAGAPGHGKTTMATALAEFYAGMNKIVKTLEAPRDLMLPDSITQYAISKATPQEIHNILLLSRPDYTIFDEIRNTADFKLFEDLRLSGVGMVGVVHGTTPIDAIQRFLGRVELGIIPHIVDTVIFIKNGLIDKVFSLAITVKVPSGMTEADLARPIVVVTDFESEKPEYELYKYGEETVVIPIMGKQKTASQELAEKTIMDEFRFFGPVEVDMVSDAKCIVYVPESKIAKVIGSKGENINRIEKKLGLHIDIKPLNTGGVGEGIKFKVIVAKKAVEFFVDEAYKNKSVDIIVDGDYLLTAKIGADGGIKLKKSHKLGKVLVDAVNQQKVGLILSSR